MQKKIQEQLQSNHIPFFIQSICKQKKKSKISQQMKQKRKQNKQIKQKTINKLLNKNLQSRINFNKQNQQNLKGLCQPKYNYCQQQKYFDNLNYIALQQFQGTIDDQRTLQAYQKSIRQNSSLFTSKIVLHLTTGCNIFYSIFAAQVGASKVYCVVNGHSRSEQQNIFMMKQIIKQNNLTHIIQVLSYKNFNAQIDIIIAQPMGYFMHFDGMLDRIVQSRDLYLDKNKGLIFPRTLKFKCALVKDQHFYDKKVQYWNEVYGISMKTMKKWISHQPIVKIVDPSLIVSQIVKFIHFDLNQVTYQQITQIQKIFDIKIFNDTQANGLCIWFQIQFPSQQTGQKIQLKGSPWQNSTKFTHVTLYSHEKIVLKKNQSIKVNLYGKKYPHQGVNIIKVNLAGIQTLYKFS